VYSPSKWPWPTAAAACNEGMSEGFFARPSGARPAAIAPEETKITSMPAARAAARPVHSDSSLAASGRPDGPTSDAVPTFTTRRSPASS
jgi:hypothetical protein